MASTTDTTATPTEDPDDDVFLPSSRHASRPTTPFSARCATTSPAQAAENRPAPGVTDDRPTSPKSTTNRPNSVISREGSALEDAVTIVSRANDSQSEAVDDVASEPVSDQEEQRADDDKERADVVEQADDEERADDVKERADNVERDDDTEERAGDAKERTDDEKRADDVNEAADEKPPARISSAASTYRTTSIFSATLSDSDEYDTDLEEDVTEKLARKWSAVKFRQPFGWYHFVKKEAIRNRWWPNKLWRKYVLLFNLSSPCLPMATLISHLQVWWWP